MHTHFDSIYLRLFPWPERTGFEVSSDAGHAKLDDPTSSDSGSHRRLLSLLVMFLWSTVEGAYGK